ncbi:MAG: hypothetical protein LLF92_00110 [Planctomycetaceae bacterium]|nr:hypothetical protein [Planctomycetaceae bacterium]
MAINLATEVHRDFVMIKVILLSIAVICLIISIWQLYSRKDSSKRRLNIFFIILSTMSVIIGIFYDPTPKNFGALKPKQKVSYTINNNEKNSIQYRSGEQIIKITGLNQIIQPFGPNVYFSLRKTKEGLLVSAKITSLDNKIVAKMINNQWVLNPNNYFRKYYDESTLEVIDAYEVPVLQIEYLDQDTVKIGGIFRAENDLVSKIDSDFPAIKDPNDGGVGFWVPNKSIIIVGINGMRSGGYLKKLSLDEFIVEAKTVIKPWLDYNDPQIPCKRRLNN